MKGKVVILQNVIMAYRKPLYNMLSEHYDVTVVHAGEPSVTRHDLYREEIVPARQVGPFVLQNWLPSREMRAEPKAVIAMFNLRWLPYILPVFMSRRTRYVLWGGWYGPRPLVNRARDFVARRADAVLLYGDEEIDRMAGRGVDRRSIFVAPNTVHVPNHGDFSGRRKSSLLFVGRLMPRKRPDLLIEAFARTRCRLPKGMVVDIVGSGELRPALGDLARRLGIETQVRFHGAVTDPDRLSALFAAAYAYVSPEHIGLGGLHSFAHGVAVITRAPRADSVSDFRYGPEFLNLKNGENALIYDRADQLDAQILRICTEEGLARRLGGNGYRLYSGTRTMEHMVAGFRRAIEG